MWQVQQDLSLSLNISMKVLWAYNDTDKHIHITTFHSAAGRPVEGQGRVQGHTESVFGGVQC